LVVGGYVQMITDANAADRYPYLQVWKDGSNTMFNFMATTPQTASLTQYWTFGPGSGQSGPIGNNLKSHLGIGDGIEVPAGGYIQCRFLNIQAGDDATAFVLYYKVMPQ
jgi:hypothetical protein